MCNIDNLFYLHAGSFSGINDGLLRAWREGCPGLPIETRDLNELCYGGVLGRLRAMPAALSEGGISALRKGGPFTDAVQRSDWYWKRLRHLARVAHESHGCDVCLSIGTVIPIIKTHCPTFIYTDHAILANRRWEEGQERLKYWEPKLEMERETLSKATLVFTMSNDVSNVLVEDYGLPAERVVRVKAGYNVRPPVKPTPLRDRPRNILFIGLEWERKGGPVLVEAFRKVRDRYPEATLTILGAEPSLHESGVEVVGRLPMRKITDYLARATVFAMPSLREPFGIVYLEAMAASLPVIASNQGAAPDFVIDGETGFLVEPGDSEGLAETLIQALADPEETEAMGNRAREMVENNYTWQKTQERMAAAIGKVMDTTK